MQKSKTYEQEFGDRLRTARKNKKLRQKDVAEMMCFSANEVLNWEGGKRMPTLYTACELAKLLDVSAGWLIAGERNA